MNSDKSIILRTFNKIFFDFINDIISIYPDNIEILTAKETFETFKKMNPTSIIKVWNSCVYSKYKEQIDSGDIEFFTNKDYSPDLSELSNMKMVLDMINNVREPIKHMSQVNKEHASKYIQNLSKLSVAYSSV
jgi:hypothetical protein